MNPAAGGGRAARELRAVEESLALRRLGYRVERTTCLEHARELALAAVAAGEIAVAFGGDGIIAAVAGALQGSDALLGVLPGGRGNDFARALGIPLDPRDACEVLANGIARSIDVGVVNASTFIGIASCGLDSDANRIANETRLVSGNFVYAYGALRALAEWKPAEFHVAIDGGDRRAFTGYSVAAANSPAYGGGMRLAPHASMQDGLLDVVMIAHVPKARFLCGLPSVYKGEHIKQSNVEVVRARELEIGADRPLTMYADGDPVAELPVRIRALRGAVRVLVPSPVGSR
ncbi:MAG: diacylglycerol kinase family lipid kinase [Solirubrobacterales bacterium]|nr:diacylglycerol kinase family lipid kinase [Solirubrobacterales bacterium]